MKHKEKKFMEYMKEKDDREGKEGEEVNKTIFSLSEKKNEDCPGGM